jgi:hypothetical protein
MVNFRPNGPAVILVKGEWLARWAENVFLFALYPQGVALGWVNRWTFGP